jgi:replicative DNA helicase
MSAIGRQPPHAIDAEEYLLGCILIGGAEDLSAVVNRELKEWMFYLPKNQKIFARLLSMLADSKTIDLAVLAQEMITHKELEDVGGYAYLTQVSGRIPTSAQVTYFADKIRELYLLRETIKEASRLVESCYAYDGDGVSATLDGPVSRLLALSAGTQVKPEPEWAQVVDEAEKVLNSIIENKGLPKELIIEFPWKCMNEAFTPMQRGQLIIIAARPSVGKSSLARPIALHAAKAGHKIYFVTLEVNAPQVALQMAAVVAKVGIRQVATAHDRDKADLRAGLKGLRNYGITISRRDNTIARILGRARALHARGQLDLLVLDHGLLVQDIANCPKDDRASMIGTLTKALKHLAGELNIPCVLLWQLNRASVREGNREPNLTDLKDSGSLEEDADKVIFIHRPSRDGFTEFEQKENATPDECPSFYQNIIQAKGRDDGTNILSFYFHRATTTFTPAVGR